MSFLAIFQAALRQNNSPTVNENDTTIRLSKYEITTARIQDDVTVTSAKGDSNLAKDCTFLPESEPESANFVLLYILICIYSFLAITVTCHQYFVTSMSRICEGEKCRPPKIRLSLYQQQCPSVLSDLRDTWRCTYTELTFQWELEIAHTESKKFKNCYAKDSKLTNNIKFWYISTITIW